MSTPTIGHYINGQVATGASGRSQSVTNPATGQPLSDAPNRVALRGAGLTVSWQAQAGLDFKATLARRIGANPNPSATGRDQDGSLQLNRIWISANLAI